MLSLRKLFGKDEKFYDLLEASADEVLASTKLFSAYLQRGNAYTASSDLDEFIQSRQKNKQITSQITEELCKTFVTPPGARGYRGAFTRPLSNPQDR
jgi:hypothetical protein